MRGYNRVIIAGNLAQDPELRYTVNKSAYARFSVAINTPRKDQNGNYQDSVEYVNVVVWGATAENCGKYLKKGSGVLVEGRLQTSVYEAKDGSGKRRNTEVVGENVQFIGAGNQNSGGGSRGSYSRSQPQQNQPNNSRGNYNQPSQPFNPPTDDGFGKSIGESGFGGFPPDFEPPEPQRDSDVPF
ncbi:MAG: single-stranded DNA-binding protein [Synergistaceae bacterium]|nr:single-stranded DNA-binding protein [Synergistaceae bacterium]